MSYCRSHIQHAICMEQPLHNKVLPPNIDRFAPSLRINSYSNGQFGNRDCELTNLRTAYRWILCAWGEGQFTGWDLDEWAFRNRVKLHLIEPGKPVQNAVIESFDGKRRDECLNREWFTNLNQARTSIEKWREDYNRFRPHSALDDLPPPVWAQQQNQLGISTHR
jgi:transposase InsO family protein